MELASSLSYSIPLVLSSREMAEYLEELIDLSEGMMSGGILVWLTLIYSIDYFSLLGLNFLLRWSYRFF